MAINFSVGQAFESYSLLDEKIGQFEEQNFVKLAKSDCRKIKASAKTTGRQINEGLVYSDLKYSCIHGGKAYKSKSKGEHPNQSSAKIVCPFTLKLKASKDGQSLEVCSLHDRKTNGLISAIETQNVPRINSPQVLEPSLTVRQPLRFY